jgi:quinoprotein glucose dehydrogenase
VASSYRRRSQFRWYRPSLVPQSFKPEDAWGLVYLDRIVCRDRIAALRSEGLYTPPSLRGTLLFPFTGGGVNWGVGAFDPECGLYVSMSLDEETSAPLTH